MSNQNPWDNVKNEDYEKHMGHPDVGQLQMLSAITADQLALVKNLTKPKIAILGITNGNGLEHINPCGFSAVIGMDISKHLLEICQKTYAHLFPILRLYQINLMTEKDRAISILADTDLIIANLIIEHIHLENFIDIVGQLQNAIVSVVIQINPDGALVSKSGYERAFEEIAKHVQECDEEMIVAETKGLQYSCMSRTEYPLPNKKSFVRLDFKRGE